jgi:hypothetical protein
MTVINPQISKGRRAVDGKRCRLQLAAVALALLWTANAAAQSPPTQAPPTQTPPAQATPAGQSQPPAQTTPATPAPASEETPGRPWGNYLVHQSVEFGYRDSMIGGNQNNYATFENLQSGMRLFDYSMDMHSINHQGILFDNLSFTNFGYGGDPNNVSRLHIDKNKWYDFRAMFRRDKNFWNYDLMANPLNTSTQALPTPIVSSPHSMDLSRHMQDYDLTLLPQSMLRFRLGYSRNSNQGPAAGTIEGGEEPLLTQLLLYRTSSYRIGVDYRGIPKTTLSFDEILTYSKVDKVATDTNLTFQTSTGLPVDLGLVFIGTSPCAAPISNPATTPKTITPTCNAFLSYSQVQNPRSSFPTERFRFQSAYFKNFTTGGSIGYSSGNDTVSNFNEMINGWTSRTIARGGTTAGPSQAKRISVNADWTGDYRLTDKLSIEDDYSFENWRSPSMWNTIATNLFGTPPAAPGQSGLLLPISVFTPATFATVCPTAPYNGPNCPQHNTSSLSDVTGEFVSRFLGQSIQRNLIELKYDFTRRVSVHAGYLYSSRNISDFSATFDTGEIYFPGGTAGNAGNLFLAARGDCAMVAGHLPAACTLNPNGSVQEGTPTNLVPDAGNDVGRNITQIHEHALLAGVSARPTDKLRMNAEVIFGYNDNSFTRISPRQVQSYKFHASYDPKPWARVDLAADLHENRDNVLMVNNIEHGRTYSFMTTLSPGANLWVDFGYHYMDIYTQTAICFADTGSTVFTAACPVPGATGPLGNLSFYSSKDHYAYADVMWKPHKRVTAMLGYAGSIVRGNTTFLNPLSPTGTLDFNYLKPFVSLAINIRKDLTYKTSWNYFGYNDHGVVNPIGLAPLPSQDFNGSNVTFSLKYVY